LQEDDDAHHHHPRDRGPHRGPVGVDIDYETVGNNMLMVSASGTAVKLG
jgi:hypothetical protein